MAKSPNVVVFIRLFVRPLKKKKVDTCTSTIDQSAQIDFHINFEKRMDNFADLHKNSRILSK
jgi:hypothetical protein